MTSMIRIVEQREILLDLVSKNLKAKYASSALGTLWAFINPLLLALIVGFVFTNILKVNTPCFYLFVISGMLPWAFFSTSLQESSVCILAHAHILKQFSFSRILIPASVVLSNFVLLLAGMLILLPVFIVVNSNIVALLPTLIIALILLFFFTLGVSLLLAAMCVEWRDMQQLLGTLLIYWLWLTPVFYSVDMIPKEYEALLNLNPVNGHLRLFREILFDGEMPSLSAFGIATLVSLIAVGSGTLLFYKKERGFLKRL